MGVKSRYENDYCDEIIYPTLGIDYRKNVRGNSDGPGDNCIRKTEWLPGHGICSQLSIDYSDDHRVRRPILAEKALQRRGAMLKNKDMFRERRGKEVEGQYNSIESDEELYNQEDDRSEELELSGDEWRSSEVAAWGESPGTSPLRSPAKRGKRATKWQSRTSSAMSSCSIAINESETIGSSASENNEQMKRDEFWETEWNKWIKNKLIIEKQNRKDKQIDDQTGAYSDDGILYTKQQGRFYFTDPLLVWLL